MLKFKYNHDDKKLESLFMAILSVLKSLSVIILNMKRSELLG